MTEKLRVSVVLTFPVQRRLCEDVVS